MYMGFAVANKMVPKMDVIGAECSERTLLPKPGVLTLGIGMPDDVRAVSTL